MTSQNPADYILNPFTQRLIKKGSKTYKRLVSARLLDEKPAKSTDSNLILEMADSSEAKNITTRMPKGALGKNKIVTRRGGKVLKANRRPTQTEIIDNVTSIAVETVLDSREDILNRDMSDCDLDEYIKKLIAVKLVGGKPYSKPCIKPVESSDYQENEYLDEGDY